MTRALQNEWKPLWQRGYHETLLRDAVEIGQVRRYIQRHPAVLWACGD